MEVFRLSRRKFATTLSGKGAALKGARWNSVGVELVYAAANRSLAMAEVAVHFTLATLPDDYVMMTIFIPDDVSLNKLNIADLPTDWNKFPHHVSTQAIGNQFVTENKYGVLQIPSVVTFGDFNLLINPNHPDSFKIRIMEVVDFPFDKRVFRNL